MTGGLCAVDWLAVVGVAKDVVVAIAAIVTATVAWVGVSKWRAEEAGKADFDLARRLGTVMYRFRDAIAAARRPLITAGEFPEGQRPPAEKDEADAYAHVYNRRFQDVRSSGTDLLALRNEAEALWGKEVVAKLDELLRHGSTLHAAMEADVSDKASHGADFRHAVEFGQRMRAEVFDTGHKLNSDGTKGCPNEFTTMIEKDVETVAAYLRTKLPQKSRRLKSRNS